MKTFQLLQDFLFYTALREHGIETDFQTNHQLGQHSIGPLIFGLKFPLRYVKQIAELDRDKKYDYCFIGTIPQDGRKKLLAPYCDSDQNLIRDSRYGRQLSTKFIYEPGYYQDLSHSWFCLCPVHPGKWYVHDHAWTYRFVESIFCRSIPVAFRSTPIGRNFHRDIVFYWNDQDHPRQDYEKIVEHNYCKAIEYWTFTKEEIQNVKNFLG